MIPMANAAGFLKNPADVEPLLRVPSDILTAITLGSYTPLPREGNVGGNTFWSNSNPAPTSLNALGLPNPGMRAALEFLPELIDRIHSRGKKVRVSIAAFNNDDYVDMALQFMKEDIDELEFNFGCPNVRQDGIQEDIHSFKPSLISDILFELGPHLDRVWRPNIAVKASPFSNPLDLARFAAAISEDEHKIVDTVVTSNTFANACGFGDSGDPLIDVNNGEAGLAGLPLKYITLGQVRQFRRHLPERISVTGVGGVSDGEDVRDLEIAGATAVQVGTAFGINRNPRVFVDIATNYAQFW